MSWRDLVEPVGSPASTSTPAWRSLVEPVEVQPREPAPSGGIGSVAAPRPAPAPADSARWSNELRNIDAEIAQFQKDLNAGKFGGGRGSSEAASRLGLLKQDRQNILNKIQTGKETRVSGMDVAREVVNAPFRGIVNTTLGGIAGIADIAGFDGAADEVRAYRDSVTAKYKAPEAAEQNTALRIGGQLGEGLGSTAPFLLGGAGKVGRIAAGTLASGTGIDNQDARVKAARADGIEVSETQEAIAETFGSVVGLAEMAPVSALLSKVPKGYGGKVISAISDRLAASGAGRVIGAGLEEGVQEAASGVAQDLIEAGIYNENVEIGQSALEDFALGAAVGGTIRTGVEVASGIGRRATAKGKREQLVDGDVSILNEGDINSPIPNDVIETGKRPMIEAEAESIEAAVLQKAGMPGIGADVAYEIPGRPPIIGKVEGAFNESLGGERVAGIIIRTPDGKIVRENFDDIADAGAVVRPMEQPEIQAAADAIDARLAEQAAAPSQFEQAAQSLQTPVLQPEQVSAPSSVATKFDMAQYMAKNRRAESGGNDNAKAGTSSASGRYQFTDGTWLQYHKKVFGDTGENRAQILAKKRDGAVQDRLMMELTNDSAKALRGAGLPVNDANLYLAHFLGVGGALKMLKAGSQAATNSVVDAKQIAANKTVFAGRETVGEVIAWAAKKMGQPVDAAMASSGAALPVADGTEYTDVDFGEVRRAPVAPIAIRTEERDEVITTARDRDVKVRYGVVEARDLVASNTPDGTVNPNYPADMQPRDRTRASSQMQIQQMSAKLRPYWLGRTFRPDDGAPVISPDGVVESGNGRTIAIQQVYQQGGAKADEYRRFVETQGIDTTGMEQPVLVRLRTEEMDAEAARGFAREANMATSLGMAPTEQAFADTDALPEGIMGLYQGGDVDAAANRDFVRRYMDTVMSPAEAANLRRADGSPNPRAYARIRNAMLARAYDNPRLVENLSESNDSNIVAIGGALTDIAGMWSKLRQEIAGGQIPAEYDITTNLNEAIEMVERSRREGRPLVDLVNQREMFTGETTDPVTEAVLRLLFNRPDFTKPAGRKRVRERLQAYLDDASSQRLDQGSLLDEPAAPDVAGAVRAARGMEGYENAPAPEQPAAAAAEQPTDESGATGAGPSAPAGGEPDAGPGREGVPPQRGEEAGGLTPPPAAAQAEPSSIAGQKIDDEWTAFAPSSGTLGIPRAEMPQVKAEHRGALVNFLNARGIAHEEQEVDPASLKPTQAEFSPGKVQKTKDYEGGNRAILVSSDDHVLDGHHQWMDARDEGETIRIIRFDAPIARLLEVVPEMPSATTADGATEPVTPAEDAQPDMLGGPTAEERRQALERRGDAPMRGNSDQRPAGSDGGLFDTAAQQQTDLLDAPAPAAEAAPEADVANIAEQVPDAERDARNRRLLDQAIPATDAQGFRITAATSPGVARIVNDLKAVRREALSMAQTQGVFEAQFDAIMAYTGGSARFGPIVIEAGPLETLTGVSPAAEPTPEPEATPEPNPEPEAEEAETIDEAPATEQESEPERFLVTKDDVDPQRLETFHADLAQQLQGLGLTDKVTLSVVERIAANPKAAGSYQDGLIRVALASSQDPAFTLNHEAIHALRGMRLLTDMEWATLSRRARENSALMASIKERYPDLSTEAQVEEAVADMYARWTDGKAEGKGFVRAAFERLRSFMEALRNALAGMGLRSADDIMRAVERGDVGRREGGASADNMDGERFSVPSPATLERRRGPFDTTAERESAITTLVDAMRGGPDGGAGATWKGKAADAWERFRVATQDRYLPLKKVQRTIERAFGRPLPDTMDVYRGEELMHGRMAERIDRLHDDMVRPLFDSMADAGVTIEAFESYLYARHAPERNAQIAKINPDMEGAGSGMSDTQAAAIMARIERDGKTADMEQLAARLDAIREMTLDAQVEYGLISSERATELRETYKFYVPLRGFKEVEGADPEAAARINRSGGGINVRGPEGKRAFGRRSEADSPIAYLLLQAEEAIVRGETNKVAQELYALAESNPNPDFWETQKVTSARRINPETGLVETYTNTLLTQADAPYTVSAKIDGKERRVTFNRDNPSALRLADSMRRLTDSQLDPITKYLGSINRWLSAVNTRFNPEFVVPNMLRDIQSALVNVQDVDVEGITAATVKHYAGALRAAMRGAFGKKDGDWGKWYNEFAMAGAKTAYAQINDVARIKADIEKQFAEAASRAGTNKSAMLKLKRAGKAAVDFVENMNDGVENGVRLAAYRAAREAGLSQKQAGSIAKNLTVNFNRRGQFGPAINSLYLFYNASVQGNVRLLQAIYHSKKARGIVAGVVASGLMMEMLNVMLSADDDDGESFYDKIPSFEKERNIIIMMPDGKDYIKIPLAYGLNVFWGIGRTAGEIGRRGGDRWQESAADLAATALGAFNPIGFSFDGRTWAESAVSLAMPSPLDPVVDLSQNKDFTGRPIMPEGSQFEPEDPAFRRYFPGVGENWRALTDALNEMTGGNKIEPGAISVSPETLEYLASTVFGAAGGFFDRLASIPGKVEKGEFTINDVPLARKTLGQKSPYMDRSTFYERINEVEAALKVGGDLVDAEMGPQLQRFIEDKRRVLTMEELTKEARKVTKQIRKDRRLNDGMLEKGEIDQVGYDANKQRLDEIEATVVLNYNRQWVATVYKGGQDGGE